MSAVPLRVKEAIALGRLAKLYDHPGAVALVTNNVHTARITVAIGGHHWELDGGNAARIFECICTDADEPNDHRPDCPMWRATPTERTP